ncbi:hemolysin family protein [Paenibacillus ehimensis]|uniref:Hemolysin family protein n=1 Tax=Paenibacillus ehimensis TaxID=79264 RepID=A0ABT8VHW6_9BACL|nr:hemolysin family protein [Paenibacillus ehimensis]MDO3680575.1 hemolysin family protein [Paenibacillus ehimensis]MEC0207836.1 hemolysin family protein [Paenibacillus ehimensis]
MSSDPLPLLLNAVLIIVLVLLNGFFVAAEFAMVKVRNSRIDTLAQSGNVSARFAQKITGNLNAYLSACQLGITLASLGLGWVGEPAIAAFLEPILKDWLGLNPVVIHTISFLTAFSLITALHITLGEQFPKTYAIRQSENVTLWSALPVIIFYKLMYPFIWMLNGASNWMLKRAGIEPATEHESAHTEEEIRVLVKESHKSGFIDNTELTLFDNIFEFTETNAREIMIPRTEMACLYANLSFEENMEIALREMRTRYPVCDRDKDNVIGFVHIKDLMKSNGALTELRSIVRPIAKVPDSMPISRLLKLMQWKKVQIALLIDEYGGTSGMVTLEDILEEIVGEIQDEFDPDERARVEKKDEFNYSIDGLMLIDEVNDQFGLEIESEDYDTIGGWMYSQVELPPKHGQSVVYQNEFEFVIEETDDLRIARLAVRKLQSDSQTQTA